MKKINYLFALLVFVITSCNSNINSDNQGSTIEQVKIQITAYSNEFELFAEADPFVVGKEGSILSHFSHLPNFTALENASIKIRLIVNGKESNHTLVKPTRKGIYKFFLKPIETGVGRLIFDINTPNGEFQLIAPNIKVFASQIEANEEAAKTVISTSNTTVFTKEKSWKIDFATNYPSIESFGQIIKTTAQVQSAQGDEILISAKTNGIVMISAENVLEGKKVSEGDKLVSITGSDLADNNSSVRFMEAKNNFDKTKSEYDRLKQLASNKIISKRELLNSKNQFENAKVIYENLNNNFNSSGEFIKSSMNGYIKQLLVQNGQYVETGHPIMIISQNKSLLLKAEVQQKYAPILGMIQSANIHTLYNNETYTLEELNGKVLSFGRTANNDNYLIPISIQIDNKGSFISGGFVELFLKTVTNAQALTIPNSALMEEQGVYFVYVQVNPELFEKRELKIGKTDGLKTEVLKGLKPNERIVSTGAILVKLAQATGNLDPASGHNH